MEGAWRVFVIDDESGALGAACSLHLAGAFTACAPTSEDELRSSALAREAWDVVLVAWPQRRVPLSRVTDVMREVAPGVPSVVVAPSGIATAGVVAAMRAGAADVVGPETLARLPQVVARVMWRTHAESLVRASRAAVSEGRQAANVMRSALDDLKLPNGDAFFRWAIDTSNIGVWIIGASGQTKFVNDRMAAMLGRTPPQMLGRAVSEFLAPEDQGAMKERIRAFRRGARVVAHVSYVRPDGTRVPALLESTPLFDEDGRYAGGIAAAIDVSELRAAESRCEAVQEELRQSQKMEAVGRLAGSIAHDFNNMLSVILGYADAIHERLADQPAVQEDVRELMIAGRRASDLTRQLLLFSRRHVFKPVELDVGELIEGMMNMVARLVGEDVELTFSPRSLRAAPIVRADRSGFEQVILNLVVNARDAMPTGGALAIELAERGEGSLALSVRDTGCGMSAETLARAFDPFFTTKEEGKGTGLGLATVYAIVEQTGGSIHVNSAPGHGTTFEVVLPRARPRPVSAAPAPSQASARAQAKATVLVVEDDDQVRAVTRRALQRHGHRVIEARTPLEALERGDAEVDLLLTDVVMPQMSGAELARRLTAARPALRVLFMSGYNDDNVLRYGLAVEDVAFLQKPFTPTELSAKVGEVLADASPEVAVTGAA